MMKDGEHYMIIVCIGKIILLVVGSVVSGAQEDK